MNIKTIPEPFLNQENEEFRNFLIKRSFNIVWLIDNDISGDAKCNVDKKKKNVIITLKNDSFINNQCIISEELLHAVLFIKGYSRIVPKEECSFFIFCVRAIDVLNGIFDHIILNSQLIKLNCISVSEREQSIILKNISELDDFIKKK